MVKDQLWRPRYKPYSYQPEPKKKDKPSTVLAIPDLHCPFEHPEAFAFLKYVYDSRKCNRVACVGDELDMHFVSRYPKEHDALGGKDELRQGLDKLKVLYEMFPNVEVCISNHTSRPYRMARSVGLLDTFMREYSDWMEAPKGWSWSEEVEIDGVLYFHGEPYSGFKGALNALKDLRRSLVIGHIHLGGGVWQTPEVPGKFALNTGWLGNQEEYAFRYAKKCRGRPTLGCGVVHEGKWAEFVEMK